MDSSHSSPFFRLALPQTAEPFSAFGDGWRLLLSAQETGGCCAVLLCEAPLGSEAPLHVHAREDQIFVIQSGRFEFHLDGARLEAGPGTVLFCPSHVPHARRLVSQAPGSLLVLAFPAGSEDYLRRCAHEFATGAPDVHNIGRIGVEFGISLLTPESIDAFRSMQSAPRGVKVVPPQEGETVPIQDTRGRHLLSLQDTGESCLLSELVTPAGSGLTLPPRTGHGEIFLVRSGCYEFEINGRRLEAEAGAYLFVRAGVTRRFRVCGEEPGRLMLAVPMSGPLSQELGES